ncbi:TrkH family potassium uptake protein [Actinospongicola halichondriae]|uniref:TrkH family potassium uptake protein n=1 Tax=Actinospongicola halichondriae TaxID=3236844 RepID=UPI003D58AFFE
MTTYAHDSGAFATRSRRIPNLAAHIGGAALLFVAAGILLSAVVEAGAGGDETLSLLLAAGIVAAVGALLWRTTTLPDKTSAGGTFIAVGATWIVAAIGGAVPFVLAGSFETIDGALFESVSGFTGTGSTVLDPIEDAPRGVLFWRSMTQWYGGTGMVVLAVAILPFLGIGGMDLLRAEAPGPSADRLAPRVSETAKRLWFVYGAFTIISMAILFAVGMSPFDAVTHAFTVVSTGGLSPYNNSVAAFDSVLIEVVLIVLMLYGATNFTLHYRFLTGDRGAYRHSTMFRYYLQVFVAFTIMITVLHWLQEEVPFATALRDGAFNVATLITSTGFGTVDYVQWGAASQLLLLALMISGGMAGSTAGGLKLIRVRVLFRFARREITRVRHPRGALPLRLGGDVIPERTVDRVVGYALLYIFIILVGTVALAAMGSGLPESVGGAASVMGNMGPGLGDAGPASNFLVFSRPARALLMVMMLAGRLEIFPILVIFSRLSGRSRRVRSQARTVARHQSDSWRTRLRRTG